MKKLFILCSGILIPFCMTAQSISVPNTPSADNPAIFCSTLSKIRSMIATQFYGFKNGQISSYYNNTTKDLLGNGFRSTFNFPGAIISIIELGENDIYRVYYGTYTTEAKAKAKLEIIKKRLTPCLNDFTIQNQPSKINDKIEFPIDYYFIEKKTNNSKPQVVELFLKKETGLYSVYMRVGLLDTKPITENEKGSMSIAPAAMYDGQATTGKVKWYREGYGNYTYTGELLNGKPDGIGLAISDGRGDSLIFGRFKNGMIEGRSVSQYSSGALIAAPFKENKIHGMSVVVTSSKNFSYCNFTNGHMAGKAIVLTHDNLIAIGEGYKGVYNGRKIEISSDGKTLYDNIYVNGVRSGPGYQYEAESKKKFEGIWEDDEWVRATTGNYPSFMRNSRLSGAVKSDHIYISSDFVRQGNMEQFHDTCFLYDTKNNNRWFGYWDRGQFQSGVRLIGDSTRTIGQLDEKGYKRGFCVEYIMDRYLHIGNYKDGKMDGDGITVDIKNSTIYNGMITEDSYTGNAYRLMKNKEIRIGNFVKGILDGEGKIIYPDGRSVSGVYENGKLSFIRIKEVIKPDGKKIDINPKDLNTAINFLLKEWENNFSNINSGEQSQTESGYYSWYNIPQGFALIKTDRTGIDGKPHNEFTSLMGEHGYYDLLKDMYNDLRKKIAGSTITSLAKGKSLKLIPKINKLPEDGRFERIASFFTIPAYPRKKGDPQIRVMMENKGDAFRLTVDIISKWK